MAIDQALLEQVQREQLPALRLYTWRPACLSFGRNQPARGVYDPAAAAALGIEIVRRPTGGMAVLHDCELTYAFSAPVDLLGGARATYVLVNRALVAGLRRLGIAAQLAADARRRKFGTLHPCFAEPAAGEVVVDGLKLVGSAQRCERHTILQHGSILLEGAQEDVARIAVVPFELSGRATSVRQVLGHAVDARSVAVAIAAGFEEVCGICLAPARWSADAEQRAHELEPWYRSAAWTWRR